MSFCNWIHTTVGSAMTPDTEREREREREIIIIIIIITEMVRQNRS
jgi:hypothetical protein